MTRRPVVFDLTRLVKRARFATPTGIDRFDLAYADRMRRLGGRPGRFLLSTPLGPRMMRDRDAGRLIDAMLRRWSAHRPDHGDTAALTTLLRRLGAPTPAGSPRSEAAADPSIWRDLVGALRGTALTGGRVPRDAIYLNTSHGRLDRPSRFRFLADVTRRAVFYVHDLIPILHPEYVRAGEAARHMVRMRTVLDRADLVLVNSETTADDFAAHAALVGVTPPPSAVLAPGVEPVFRRLPEPRPRPTSYVHPYFVVVGTIEPRKNHQLLLDVWGRLVERHGDAAPRLVVVGRRGWANEDVFARLDRPGDLAGHVLEVAGLGDGALAELMAGARAVLSPSRIEGYGMPIAEAVAADVPVIASDIPAHRAVAGEAADLLDPQDEAAWTAMIEAACDPAFAVRRADLRRARAAELPTWDDHFARLESALERL